MSIFFIRDRRRAIRELKIALETEPNHDATYEYLGMVYLQKRMHEQAIGAFRQACFLAPNRPVHLIKMGSALAIAGKEAEARKVLSELEVESRRTYVSQIELSKLYLALGYRDQALQLLERGFSAVDPRATNLKVEPAFDPLRSDPRFQALLDKMKFPK